MISYLTGLRAGTQFRDLPPRGSKPLRVTGPRGRRAVSPNLTALALKAPPRPAGSLPEPVRPAKAGVLRTPSGYRAETRMAALGAGATEQGAATLGTAAAAALPLALQPLHYFVGRWHVEGGTWSGLLHVRPTQGAWLLLDLALADSANPGCSRNTQMRDGYNPHLKQFVRRKEADNGSYFDYCSGGWSQGDPSQWVWQGTGYNFYGQQQGPVRSVCNRQSANSFSLTDFIQRDGHWSQTYSLTYRRLS
jgi:hypothetical protein